MSRNTVNVFVREKGYIAVEGYEGAAHLVDKLEERASTFIDFEIDESVYGGLTGKKYERFRKVYIRCSDIIAIEDAKSK